MTPDPRFDIPEPDQSQQKKLREAYGAFEDGNADRTQARLILQHLASLTGYYNGRSLTAWMAKTGSPVGFETACIELQARRWVFSEILPYLTRHVDGRS